MAAAASDESRAGIGARLRAGRERSGLTLLQAAEKLHVDSKILEALEAENFENLGAPVFARGHLRRYAELVGEQAAQLQGLYNESTRPPPLPDLTRAPRVRRRADSRRLVAPGVAGLIAIAILGGVWVVLQVLNRNAPETATTEHVVPPTVVAGSEEPAQPEGSASGKVSSPAPGSSRTAATARPAGSARGAQSQQGERPSPVGSAAGASSADAAKAAAKTAEQAAAPVKKPRTVNVTLKFAADSWVEIYDVNGERLFYDIGSADSVRNVTGTPPLRVVLGNAPGVSLEVNGRAAKVPDSARQDEGAQFTINRAGRITK